MGSFTALDRKKITLKGLPVAMAAQQLWCEQQLQLKLQFNPPKTDFMIKGEYIHNSLNTGARRKFEASNEKERFIAYIQSGIDILSSSQDVFFELPVFSFLNNILFLGRVDKISINNKKVILEEFKSSKSDKFSLVSDNILFQMMMYYYLYMSLKNNELNVKNYENYILSRFSNEIEEPLKKKFNSYEINIKANTIADLIKMYKIEFSKLPELETTMILTKYIQENIEHKQSQEIYFQQGFFNDALERITSFWQTNRKPHYVSRKEKWKCKACFVKQYCEYFSQYFPNEQLER